MAKSEVAAQRATVRGVVEVIFLSSPNFSAGRLRTDDGERVRFAGKVYVRENDPVSLRGSWDDHPKYGRQFAADGLDAPMELDGVGLANYLANHPEISGIGPAKAKLIADEFGRNFDEVIRANPHTVAIAANVSMNTVHNLQRVWIRANDLNAAMTRLSAFGLTHYQVTALVGRFGNHVVAMLRQDPYMLISEIPGFGFKRVDKIARLLGTPKELPSRLQAGLLYTVESALNNGDCWIEYEDLVDRANKLLVMDTLDSRGLIERQLEDLIGAKRLVCCPHERLVVADPAIHEMEEFLAGVFRRAWEPNPNRPASIAEDRFFVQLNDDQRAAAQNAFRFSISLMTGGAGSGKTFTIESVVAAAEDLGLSYELAAPTGKAAKRLEQSVKRPAKTVHRLLGFNGRQFAKGPDNKLDADLLVIDEVSMVDVPLMCRLFKAIDLGRTAVLLVGDHNQLPSVGPGNILRDLVQSNAIPTTVLTRIIRQAGALKENSTAILDGEIRPTSDLKIGGYRPWYVSDTFTDREHVRRFLEQLFNKVLAERLGFDLLRDVQVLTPTHKGPLGTVELNAMLQRLLQKKLFGVEVAETGRRTQFLAGDKVIQTKNDYELGVMNGAIGYVVENDPARGLSIDFDGAVIEIAKGGAKEGNIQLAYATSIHKMQGSEFPCAVVIIHRSHTFMHHRNLIYTAVTRAQKSAIILGDRWGIENCAKKQQADRRNTFLSFLLQDARRIA